MDRHAIAFAAAVDITQQQPGVDHGRNGNIGLLDRAAALGQIGEQAGDLFCFQKIHQPHQHRFDFDLIVPDDETVQRIHDHHLRFEDS